MPRKIFPIFLLFLYDSGLLSAQNWSKVSTPHFEIDTQTNSQDALRALETFEQTRAVFLQLGLGQGAQQPVRIIDLSGDHEYSRFLIKPGAYGCYQRGRRGDYILLRDLSPAHSQVAVHEYTHFVVEHAGWKLPVWLNEGIAEVYSTMEMRGAQCVIGRAQAGRLLALSTYRRLPLTALWEVDSASRYYNDPREMQIFYAESWALTHMLALGDGYSPHFNNFVQAISNGVSAETALGSVYGKSLRKVEADLDAYLRNGSMRMVAYEIKVQRESLQPTCASLSKAEVDLSAADLLASNISSGPDAIEEVKELARRHPHDAGFEETLGYLALRYNQTEEARAHFASAVERQSEDPVTIYNAARLQQAAGAAPTAVMPLLERVVALDPAYEPARLDLGFTAAHANQFELAISTLSKLQTVSPKVAFEVFYTMAYCEVQLHRPGDASGYAAQAEQHARTSEQREQVAALMRYLNRQEVASLRH